MKTLSPEDNPLVLVVDDDPMVRLIACEILGLAGFRTEMARNGNEALAVIPSLKPDVILLDFSMPGGDGIAICGAIRRAGFRIPVVMLTGIIDEDTIQRALDTGAMDCIQKPPEWMSLGDRLRFILRADRAAEGTLFETP
ncbi:MAG: response regulator [Deltaproteobacteria bacterium]|nr:response regulator [Deltaproteobacteria bacterium]MDH3382534.1 response regulator [Deltaproteobacteria bacterium]